MNQPVSEYPSCLHTMLASSTVHSTEQTDPHSLLRHISTRPSLGFVPSNKRICPSSQESSTSIKLK